MMPDLPDRRIPIEDHMGEIHFTDSTLRDGEQTAYVVFSDEEKIRIAEMLDEVGVDQIEAGIPAMGGDERELVSHIAGLGLRASILGWCRATKSDIDAALSCGVDAVAISLATSDIHMETKLRKTRSWVLDTMRSSVAHAKSSGIYVSVSAEDASRTDLDFLIEYIHAAQAAGADRFRFCDTLGIMEPFRMYETIRVLSEETDMEIEVHTHNDFGMAVANALAGLHAGASWVDTTIGGLGERAGNAGLETLVMALQHIEGRKTIASHGSFRDMVSYVMAAANRSIAADKPIVGSNIFAHESGIHADGVIKNPSNYEPFSPEEVGGQRRIVVGKHSGTNTLKAKFLGFGEPISDKDARRLLSCVRSEAIRLKRALSDDELMALRMSMSANR